MIERYAGRPVEKRDIESINDAVYAETGNDSFALLKQRMIDGHNRAFSDFSNIPNLEPDHVKGDTWEHYEEHGEEIDAWRKRLIRQGTTV